MSALLIFIGLLAFSNAYPQKVEDQQVGSNVKDGLSSTISKFHSSFWPVMTAREQGNIFYSPFSLYVAMSQLYFGSPKGSDTNSELASLLQLSAGEGDDDTSYLNNFKQAIGSLLEGQEKDQSGSTIRIANRMYSAEGITLKKKFLDILDNYFSSTVEEVNFSKSQEAAEKINQFASDQTNGLINNVILPNSLSSDTKLVLMNAIYFKGTWKYKFNPGATRIKVFHVDDTRQANYSAMAVTGKFKVSPSQELESEILELPYNDGKTSMIIVLPDTNSDIRKVENLLGNHGLESLIELVNVLDFTPDVNVVFPTFETAFDISSEELEHALKQLRVETIFNSSRCNLSEITNQKTFINKIGHKAVIKVNEEGSEAAAVASIYGFVSPPSPSFHIPKHFIVDRPFLMFIVDSSSKLPLFAGRIVDPSGAFLLQSPRF